MAKRKAAKKPGAGAQAKGSKAEPMVVALAERLGSFLGRVRKKADGWRGTKAKKAGTAKAKTARSGATVDAQGKRYRKPPPQELFDPRLGEPMGTQMGQKNLKRRGRG